MSPVTSHILLVEDNPIEAMAVQQRLATCGEPFDVAPVGSMAEALKLLQSTPFDAAVLDLSLPDCDGITALERIVAAKPLLPIIVLTGMDDEALATQAIRKGAQDYLVKDQFSIPLLRRAIRYACERKQAERSLRESEERLSSEADRPETAHSNRRKVGSHSGLALKSLADEATSSKTDATSLKEAFAVTSRR